jgi:hypothetical protein
MVACIFFVLADRRSCIQPEVRRIETDGTSGMQAEAQSVSRTKFQVSTFEAFQLFSVHNLHPAHHGIFEHNVEFKVVNYSSSRFMLKSLVGPSTGVVAMAMCSHCAVKIDKQF